MRKCGTKYNNKFIMTLWAVELLLGSDTRDPLTHQ